MRRIGRCREGEGEAYDGLLQVLREGGRGFEKGMRVEGAEEGGMRMVRELHFAWGGWMVVNGMLEWKDVSFLYVILSIMGRGIRNLEPKGKRRASASRRYLKFIASSPTPHCEDWRLIFWGSTYMLGDVPGLVMGKGI